MKTKKKDKSFSYVDFAYADINNHLFTRDTKFLFFNELFYFNSNF